MEEKIILFNLSYRKSLGDPKLGKELIEKLRVLDTGQELYQSPKISSLNKNITIQERYGIFQQTFYNCLLKWSIDSDDKTEDIDNEHKKIKLDIRLRIQEFDKKVMRSIDSKNNPTIDIYEDLNRDLESDSFEQLVVIVPTYNKEELDYYEEHNSTSNDSETSSSSLNTELYHHLLKHILGENKNNQDRYEIKKLILALIDKDD